MAVSTETKVVQISVLDDSNRTKTFNIDNPKNDLTFLEVQNALAPAFQGGWWYSSYGDKISKLSKVIMSTAIKVPLERGDFTYSPTSLTMSRTYSSGGTSSQSITYSGATPQNVSIVTPQFQFSSVVFYATINAQDNTITVTGSNSSSSSETLPESATENTLIITVEGLNIEVPITFQ